MRLSDDDLRAALRAEAAAHQPDRDAMLSRITMAATSAPVTRRRAARRGPRVRMAAAATAVVALFAGGGFANWALAGSDDAAPPPPPAPVISAPAPTTEPATEPTGEPSARPSAEPSAASPSLSLSPSLSPSLSLSPSRKPSSAPPEPAPTTEPARGTRVQQGPLWSDGSVVDGSSVVTLTTTERLTSLDVVIRVARTEGLAVRGATKQTPGGSVTTSVTEEADAFQYRFVLSPADTLEPGTYTFTAKYTHPAESRDAGGDTYRARAATASAPALDVYGDFY
ncbi:hypothetical protein AB0F72_01220 [Actinoplanes sp. NPDC023936]|uniref:hypothetical protein n=1 Tax=Actinoplanes sp. NPDC023936 TaxID=3154910 RepID=UPI0033D804C2